jgi:hypothetical protein
VRQEIADFTSFYLYSFTRRIPHALRAGAWPRITRFDDRWRCLVTSVVPRFRRFDAGTHSVDASLQHILDEGRDFASSPCVLPRSPAGGPPRAAHPRRWHRPRPNPVNRSPGDRLLPVARPRLRPAGGSSWHRIANWPRPATVTLHDGLRAYGRCGCAAPAKPPGTRWHRTAPVNAAVGSCPGLSGRAGPGAILDGGPTPRNAPAVLAGFVSTPAYRRRRA